jgi:hypothetical protein
MAPRILNLGTSWCVQLNAAAAAPPDKDVPCAYLIGGLEVPEACLDAEAKCYCVCGKLKLGCPSRTTHYTDWAVCHSSLFKRKLKRTQTAWSLRFLIP